MTADRHGLVWRYLVTATLRFLHDWLRYLWLSVQESGRLAIYCRQPGYAFAGARLRLRLLSVRGQLRALDLVSDPAQQARQIFRDFRVDDLDAEAVALSAADHDDADARR